MLRKRNLNITKYFIRIIKIFEDFKLTQELRKEIETIKLTKNLQDKLL